MVFPSTISRTRAEARKLAGIHDASVVGVKVRGSVGVVKGSVAEAGTVVDVDVAGIGVRLGIAEGLVIVELNFRVSSTRLRKKRANVFP